MNRHDYEKMMREEPDIRTSNVRLFEEGSANEFTPPIVTCEHCGAVLPTYGLIGIEDLVGSIAGTDRGGIFWRPSPIRCDCEEAVGFWRTLDMLQEKQREDARLKREMQQRDERLSSMLDSSELQKTFAGKTFDSLKPATEAFEIAVTKCRWYAANFEKLHTEGSRYRGTGLYLTGGVGSGKTHLAAATALEIVEQGIPVVALRSVELYQRIRATYERGALLDEMALMQMLTESGLLMIDDLGKERPTDWTLEKLFDVIDRRYAEKKPVLITCNYTDTELIERLVGGRGDRKTAEAIVSRIKGMCNVIDTGSLDYRTRGAA